MTIRAPFQPQSGQNQVVTPAAASASATIPAGPKSVRLVNSGLNICHVRIGQGTQTASTADMPVRSGESVIVQRQENETTVAHISASGTTLHIQPGEGGV
jgi:hypothetical protein